MTPRLATRALAVLVLLLGAVAVRRWVSERDHLVRPIPVVGAVARGAALVDGDSLAVAAAATIEHDPFRLANAPAQVRYDPRVEEGGAAAMAMPLPAQRPTLALRAIVGGPPWQAVVDGIPGQPPGTIVRAGSTFDKLAITSVTRDQVVVRGADTTWTLVFRSTP